MDRPRTAIGIIVRIVLIAICAAIAAVVIYTAFGFVGDFISPESGSGRGSVGYLFLAALALVFSAPFVALTLALGMPLVSDDPRWRGADH